MKTPAFIKTILLSSAIALLITACKKEPLVTPNSTPDSATITAAIQGMRTAYNSTKTYNDSLNFWYNHPDSTHYIAMMNYCDSLYHQNDYIMMNNYNIMNSGGSMMNGGTMNGGTTNGGMMSGNNTTYNCTINGNNSTTMISSLHQQHIHHPTH